MYIGSEWRAGRSVCLEVAREREEQNGEDGGVIAELEAHRLHRAVGLAQRPRVLVPGVQQLLGRAAQQQQRVRHGQRAQEQVGRRPHRPVRDDDVEREHVAEHSEHYERRVDAAQRQRGPERQPLRAHLMQQ